GDGSSPALSATGVFVSYACDQAYAFAPQTLSLLWHYTTSCTGGGAETPVYADGQVFIRDSSKGNLVLDASTGNVVRSFAPASAPIGMPAVDQTTIFLRTASEVSAQDRATGALKWTYAEDGLRTVPIVIANAFGEWVVAGSSSGRLSAIDAATGLEVWSAQL